MNDFNSVKDALKKAGVPVSEDSKAKVHTAETTAHNVGQKTGNAGMELPEDYTARAEQVILGLKKDLGWKYSNFTTSKIRNILSMVSEIYNDVLTESDENLSKEIQSRIAYLKVRLVYECGREPDVVKPFVQSAGLLELISGIGASRKKFTDFSHYMEALVAYHRFHGGRD